MSSSAGTAPDRAATIQVWLIVAMGVWGLNVAAVKQLTGSFDSLLLAALRMVVAVIALSVAVYWKGCRWPAVSARQLAALVLCGFLMVYLNQLLFAEGLTRSTATNGALIMALSPLVSAVLATLLFSERMGFRRAAGVLLGLVGVAAVILSHPGAHISRASSGDLMLVAGVVSFATGGAMVQRLSRHMHPLWISWAIYVVGTAMLLVQTMGSSTTLTVASIFPGWWPWALILFSGVLATAVSNLVWNGAIAAIGVARTAVFLYLVPLFGVAFAAILLGERLNAWHALGFATVVAGTYLGSRRPG